jgi:hypothetical protein
LCPSNNGMQIMSEPWPEKKTTWIGIDLNQCTFIKYK